jgi:D-lactate dehydrogenase (cytochrome)
LADIIEISKKEMDDLGLFASILGHIGDGNFHESILYDRNVVGEREKVEACVKNMVTRALEMEGTCTVSFGQPLLWYFADGVSRASMVLALGRRRHC